MMEKNITTLITTTDGKKYVVKSSPQKLCEDAGDSDFLITETHEGNEIWISYEHIISMEKIVETGFEETDLKKSHIHDIGRMSLKDHEAVNPKE